MLNQIFLMPIHSFPLLRHCIGHRCLSLTKKRKTMNCISTQSYAIKKLMLILIIHMSTGGTLLKRYHLDLWHCDEEGPVRFLTVLYPQLCAWYSFAGCRDSRQRGEWMRVPQAGAVPKVDMIFKQYANCPFVMTVLGLDQKARLRIIIIFFVNQVYVDLDLNSHKSYRNDC